MGCSTKCLLCLLPGQCVDEPIRLDLRLLGTHLPDGGNLTIKERGKAYTLARLEKDHPELFAIVTTAGDRAFLSNSRARMQ